MASNGGIKIRTSSEYFLPRKKYNIPIYNRSNSIKTFTNKKTFITLLITNGKEK